MPFAILALAAALELNTLEGHDITVSNFNERKGTVLVFLSSRCPVTIGNIKKIEAFHEKYRHEGVLFVGISSNSDESGQEIKAFLQANGVRFPVYQDPGSASAKRLGASFTPEGFLLDNEGETIFHGGFQIDEAAVLFDRAINALLSGESIPASSDEMEPGAPLDRVGEKREWKSPYGAPAFSSELIFETIPGAPAHHCSSLTETQDGDLLCIWYGGSYESSDDQKIFLSRRRKGERAWSRPEILIEGEPLHPPGNAVIFHMDAGRTGLLWGRMDASRPLRRGGGWGENQLMYRFSDDDGKTWSDDVELSGLFACLPRNLPVRLRDGRWAAPISGKKSGGPGGFLLITRDNGQKWEPLGEIDRGSQPTIIERKDESLLAFLRSSPRILKSESNDGGQTWTPTDRTDLNCPGAAIAMRKLDNGHVVLVHNDSPAGRTPLSIRLSLDEGDNWGDPLHLESNPGEYSYPSLIQTSDGRIHVTYTFRRYSIKHVELNEDWILHPERPN